MYIFETHCIKLQENFECLIENRTEGRKRKLRNELRRDRDRKKKGERTAAQTLTLKIEAAYSSETSI
jgi:hypothetical protein